MSQVAVQIQVDTESLIAKYPSGSTMIENPDTYISMTVVEGGGTNGSASNITGSETSSLRMDVTQATDIRFYGVPKTTGIGASVDLVQKDSAGNQAKYQPTTTIVGGTFFYDGDGDATGKTVSSTQSQQPYNFIMRVDGYNFTFTWDPYLGVSSS